MRQAFELGWANAYVYARQRPYIEFMDDILFQAPVEIGSLLYFNSQVIDQSLCLSVCLFVFLSLYRVYPLPGAGRNWIAALLQSHLIILSIDQSLCLFVRLFVFLSVSLSLCLYRVYPLPGAGRKRISAVLQFSGDN
jgi:hypothetical protein